MCRVPDRDNFTTDDLFEQRNMKQARYVHARTHERLFKLSVLLYLVSFHVFTPLTCALQVILCMLSLGRRSYHIPGYCGPCLGKPELANAGNTHCGSYVCRGREGWRKGQIGRLCLVWYLSLWSEDALCVLYVCTRGGGCARRALPCRCQQAKQIQDPD